MLKKRVISGCILALAAIGLIWFDEPIPWLTAGVLVWGFLAHREFNAVVTHARVKPLTTIGFIGSGALIVSPHFSDSAPLILTAWIAGSLLYLLLPGDRSQAFIRWAWTLAGVIYVGWFLSFIVALRGLENGMEWVFFAIGVTAASDTSAYFIGSLAGRHKMAPSISPKKSWEGAVGGAVFAAAMALALKALFDMPLGWVEAVILGLATSAVGQAGDLVESLFKRNMAIKDSGHSIPGHGGLLDRMDSVVFAAALVYYYVTIIVL